MVFLTPESLPAGQSGPSAAIMATAEEDPDADQVRRIPDFTVFPDGGVVAWPRPQNPEHRRQLEECIASS
jgi:hypothetical protein